MTTTKTTKPSIKTKWAQTKWNLTYAPGRSHKYIVDHYTGTDACAENNCKYFGGGNRQASADFFIDKDGTTWQFNANLDKYYSWHCGDGYGRYGITNANSVGIEVVSSGGKFTAAQQEALRKLHLWLMAKYGIPASRVVRHYDASRKLCPKPYCGSKTKDALWNTLHAFTTKQVNEGATNKTQASGASYRVKITAGTLNVRNGAGTSYKVNTVVKKGDVYTIVQEKTVGASKWGKLKSGAGWINLGYTKKV